MTSNTPDFRPPVPPERPDLGATEGLRLIQQAELDRERTSRERNEWGQFATPPALARDVAEYVLKLHAEPKVDFLEPSCGSGAFFAALLGALDADHTLSSAVGVELDPRFAELASELWGEAGLTVTNGDFTDAGNVATASASLVLANPPYVRHHHLAREQKEALVARSRNDLGIAPSGLSGLYVHFMLLAHRALRPGAVSAWLIPSEFLDVNYGRALKQYLTTHVTLNRIHRFDPADVQFDDALVTSSVVVFTNAPPESGSLAEFTHGGSLVTPRERHMVPAASLGTTEKWSPRFTGRVAESGPCPRFGDYFRIRRGIATGNNKYFVLSRSDAEGRGILREHLRPMLPGPRYLRQDVVESDEFGYPRLEMQLAVIDARESLDAIRLSDPALATYLDSVDVKTLEGFLVRQRKPWYRQEQRDPAPFVLTYMGRGDHTARPFRFILNRSQAIASNMYLMLYPTERLRTCIEDGAVTHEALLLALQSLTAAQLRDGGRVYGGGLRKMEPKELAAMDASAVAALDDRLQETEVAEISLF